MKRKTRNIVLLEVVKRQEREIQALKASIIKLEQQEVIRDAAWGSHSDSKIRELNSRIRSSNKQGFK